MARPEVSLIVSTYRMPGHLRRVLASIAGQSQVDRLEILVTDDGSADETADVVHQFQGTSGLPVTFVTHPHTGFHLTRCRNDAARVSTAPYLLFLDGDCIIPPDHVEHYLAARRAGWVHFGYCCRLERELSERIDEAAIARGDFTQWGSPAELKKLSLVHYKALFYEWIRHPTKPALKGGNIGIWRQDFERINGFDENFRAWGCEDDDLAYRVRAAGLRVASILGRTRTYHLWHPPAITKPAAKWSEGLNVAYLKRRGRLTRCVNGLHKRTLHDLHTHLAGLPAHPTQAANFIQHIFGRPHGEPRHAEVQLLFHPGSGRFSNWAQCRVLVAAELKSVPGWLADAADIILPNDPARARQILAESLHLPEPGAIPAQRLAA